MIAPVKRQPVPTLRIDHRVCSVQKHRVAKHFDCVVVDRAMVKVLVIPRKKYDLITSFYAILYIFMMLQETQPTRPVICRHIVGFRIADFINIWLPRQLQFPNEPTVTRWFAVGHRTVGSIIVPAFDVDVVRGTG